MRTNRLWIGLFPLLLFGCASAPQKQSAALEQAQQEYQSLAQDPAVRQAAPSTLLQAQDALNAAANTKNEQEQQHLLYLAQQRMAIARTDGQRYQLQQRFAALKQQQLATAKSLASELSALETRQTQQGLLVTTGSDVFFDVNKAKIKPGATTVLGKIATFLRDHPDEKVVVQGNTDSTGTASYNQQLSEERANAVKQALVARGVDSSQVSAVGLGESQPIASNATSGGRQLNRRVDFVFPGITG